MPRLAITTALSLALTGPALAQQQSRHGASQPQVSAHELPGTMEFRAAKDRMHERMAIRYSGEADHDFATSMIPHHQGAIDMARIQLAYGRDPAMRHLAEQVIAVREAEIATLRALLARQAPPIP